MCLDKRYERFFYWKQRKNSTSPKKLASENREKKIPFQKIMIKSKLVRVTIRKIEEKHI